MVRQWHACRRRVKRLISNGPIQESVASAASTKRSLRNEHNRKRCPEYAADCSRSSVGCALSTPDVSADDRHRALAAVHAGPTVISGRSLSGSAAIILLFGVLSRCSSTTHSRSSFDRPTVQLRPSSSRSTGLPSHPVKALSRPWESQSSAWSAALRWVAILALLVFTVSASAVE